MLDNVENLGVHMNMKKMNMIWHASRFRENIVLKPLLIFNFFNFSSVQIGGNDLAFFIWRLQIDEAKIKQQIQTNPDLLQDYNNCQLN